MSTLSAPEHAGPALSPVPPDEQFWRRYSPHGEAPLSFAGSVALHTLGLGGALLLIIYIASVLSNSKQSLPVEPVRLELGGGGGSKAGVGDGKGVGRAPEDLGTPDENPQAGDPEPPKRPALNDIVKTRVAAEYDDADARKIAESTSAPAQAFAQFDAKMRKKLADGLNPGKGKGGTGSGGGEGTGTGPGTGDAAGPGKKATLNQRERRMLRWHMKFQAHSGPEYLAQLRSLGAILAFPVNEGADPTYKVVHDLRPGRARLESEDLSKIHRIYWIDDKPISVRDILAALGLNLRPLPSKFVAFMPQKLEDDLYKQERSYVEKVLRKRFDEDKIKETVFRAVPSGRGYKAELVSVALEP